MNMYEPWVYKELWAQEPIRWSIKLQGRALHKGLATIVWNKQPRFGDKKLGKEDVKSQVQYYGLNMLYCDTMYNCQ